MTTPATPWWQTAVLYQIYPRSFCDSDGDGQGDLQGIIDRLDHLGWLGVDGIWLSPVTVSPNADWGYDVADYCAVQPDLGTMETFDTLVSEAEKRGIRVLMDLVPNHTSVEHPWFADSRSSREAARRE
ncbi:MAG TPA: alpha-amylase family glycosyl hydrolase, partial [Acidimicrobiales bacterium]|nr:alpha-amylase family glycosyl hydrolase [Acidimicrobiales bacterium]